jgi:hypothetical protein
MSCSILCLLHMLLWFLLGRFTFEAEQPEGELSHRGKQELCQQGHCNHHEIVALVKMHRLILTASHICRLEPTRFLEAVIRTEVRSLC